MSNVNSIRQATFSAVAVSEVFGPLEGGYLTAQGLRTGAVGTATILVEGSNTPEDANTWSTVATLSPPTTGAVALISASADTAFLYFRLNCTAIPATSSVKASICKQ